MSKHVVLIMFFLLIYRMGLYGQQVKKYFDQQNQTVDIEFPDLISQKQNNGFVHLAIPGTGTLTQAGFPALPAYSFYIDVPQGSILSGEIEVLKEVVIQDIKPDPYQIPPKRNEGFKETGIDIDTAFYASANIFPVERFKIENSIYLGSNHLSKIEVYPISYDPGSNAVKFVQKLRLHLKYEEESSVSRKAVRSNIAFANLSKNFVLNSSSNVFRGVSEDPEELLVITHDLFYNSIQPYIEWKRLKGYKTSVVKLSVIGTNPDPEDVKDLITSYYTDSTKNLGYVLLVGDIDFMPAFYGVHEALNDHDYTTLIGNDILPDIFIGRFSVNTKDECDLYVNKIINYERYPVAEMSNGWFNKASIAASSSNLDNLHGIHLTAFMREEGFSTVDDLRASLGEFSCTSILDALHDGRSWMFYIGHGDVNGWRTSGTFTTYVLENLLKNYNYLPVVVSVACANADLDYGYYSFAERWMNIHQAKGAIAFIGATEDTPFYLSDTLGKYTMISYIEGQAATIGEALVYGKLKMNEAFPDDLANTTLETMEHFLILGDPCLQPWTNIPKQLFVDHPDQILMGTDSICFKVTDIDKPVANATICLYNEEYNVQLVSKTDSLGIVCLNHHFSDTGYYHVTVTGRDLKPYEAEVKVTDFVSLKDQEQPHYAIYPNPVTSEFFIRVLNGGVPLEKIEVLDLQGRMIADYVRPLPEKFSFNGPSGIYILKVTNTQNSVTLHKLVVR